MATYAIGDLQGCLDPLKQLLERIDFEPDQDRLWFVGDLVNRGPQSLDTLRFIRELQEQMGERICVTLGNHDLFLLACAYTDRRPRKKDTIGEILEAPDRRDLIDWLRGQSLFHRDADLGWTMVHAGLPRDWSLDDAAGQAQAVEDELRSSDPSAFFEEMFGDEPPHWSSAKTDIERLRYTVNALTRARYCYADGQLDFDDKRPPDEADPDLTPWFALPDRASANERIVFGHWSSLGANLPQQPQDSGTMNGWHSTWCIDQGCLWGGKLTALKLEASVDQLPSVAQVDCPGYRQIRS